MKAAAHQQQYPQTEEGSTIGTATEKEEWMDSHEYHHESHHHDNERGQQGTSAGTGTRSPNYSEGLSPPNWIKHIDWDAVPVDDSD